MTSGEVFFQSDKVTRRVKRLPREVSDIIVGYMSPQDRARFRVASTGTRDVVDQSLQTQNDFRAYSVTMATTGVARPVSGSRKSISSNTMPRYFPFAEIIGSAQETVLSGLAPWFPIRQLSGFGALLGAFTLQIIRFPASPVAQTRSARDSDSTFLKVKQRSSAGRY